MVRALVRIRHIGREAESAILETVKNAEFRLAKPCGIFQYGPKYRKYFAGGRTDDAQYLCGGFLPLQCLVALASQPRDLWFFAGRR